MFRGRAKALWIGMAAGLMMLGSSLSVFADTAGSNIGITFRDAYDMTDGMIKEPSVTSEAEGYRVDAITWDQEPSVWEPGMKVMATVRLCPDEGYAFADDISLGREAVKGAAFDSARLEADKSLTVRAVYYPVVQLGRTKKAGWSDACKTQAVWESVPYATAYQLRLYRGGGEYITTLTLSGTSVDLSYYITNDVNYYYEVRATSQNSADAVFRRNGEYVTSTETMIEGAGKTGGHWYWRHDGHHYMDETGADAVDGWRYIQGIWYYFDKDGHAVTGWCQINGKWYYMDSECRMQTGWLELEGKWYYADSTGAMAVGWHQISPAEWYYFNEDGSMACDTVIDGYRLGADGKRE